MTAFKSIPTFDTTTGEKGYRDFTYKEFGNFLESQTRLPGEYNFTTLHKIKEVGNKYMETKSYTHYSEETEDYKLFWAEEKLKIGKGIIIDGIYVTGEFYFYLNYCPIYNKVEGRFKFADLWDSDYHFFLYIAKCYYYKKDAIVVKVRQKGYSYKFISMLMRTIWFVEKTNCKILASDEDYVKADWLYAEDYRNHLNQHTPWYRNFDPDENLNWVQRVKITTGVTNKKEEYRGLGSHLVGASFARRPGKSVGGPAAAIFIEEPGMAANLAKVKGYIDANLRMGGVKTGTLFISGSIGELKDCGDFQKYCMNPSDNGFLGVPDVFSGSLKDISFFVPVYWNYIGTDETGEEQKFYDINGNSDIEGAKVSIEKEDKIRRKSEAGEYRFWLSQNPKTIQDAFASREENKFPAMELKKYQLRLQNLYRPITIRINNEHKNDVEKLTYNFIPDMRVSTLKVNPLVDNCGCVEMLEPPIEGTPFGLYYAGVDPIRSVNTTTSKSLQAVVIFKAFHMKDGKMVGDYPVAWYTGRCGNWETSYEITRDLILLYNARTAVENNVTTFNEWMIQQGLGSYLMRRNEIYLLSEWVPGTTIRDEIGVRMEGQIKSRALDFAVQYVDEIVSTYTEIEDDVEQIKAIYGMERLKDVMLIEEMIQYDPTTNTDRLIAFLLALMAARGNTSRSIIAEETTQVNNTTYFSKEILQNNLVNTYKSNIFRKRLPSALKLR